MQPFQPQHTPPQHAQPPPPQPRPPGSGNSGSDGGCFKSIVGAIIGLFAMSMLFSAFGSGSDAVSFAGDETDWFVDEPIAADGLPIGMDSAAIEMELRYLLDCDRAPAIRTFDSPEHSTGYFQGPRQFAVERESQTMSIAWIEDLDGRHTFAVYQDADFRQVHSMVMTAGRNGWWVSQIATCPNFTNLVTPFSPPTTPAPPTTIAAAIPAEPTETTTLVAGPTTSATSTTSTTSTTTTSTTTSTTRTTIPIVNGRPVPDVVGLDVNDAIIELFDWNLRLTRQDESSEDVPAGMVIRTSPKAGTQVESNSVVMITVSSGPDQTESP